MIDLNAPNVVFWAFFISESKKTGDV